MEPGSALRFDASPLRWEDNAVLITRYPPIAAAGRRCSRAQLTNESRYRRFADPHSQRLRLFRDFDIVVKDLHTKLHRHPQTLLVCRAHTRFFVFPFRHPFRRHKHELRKVQSHNSNNPHPSNIGISRLLGVTRRDAHRSGESSPSLRARRPNTVGRVPRTVLTRTVDFVWIPLPGQHRA